MPTSRKKPTEAAGKAAAKSAARNTASGPARAGSAGGDALAARAAELNDMAAAMPYNPNKMLDAGRESAVVPPEGATTSPPSEQAGASTLSEANFSPKSGEGAAPGENRTTGSLDRVRVDSTGQVLTTNQGVPIADNQNSLKAGLRGPALLEDFILREKITNFDHERIPSASSMRAARARTATSRPTRR